MLVGLVGSPRPWSPAGHRAAATREESERRGMTRGANVSATEREQEGASGPAWLLGRAEGAGRVRERERESAGALSGRAAGPSRGRRGEAARVLVFHFFPISKNVNSI
jgi:hypothetical protein